MNAASDPENQEMIQLFLDNLTGTIGEFQNPHFIIASDELEIAKMSCYHFLSNRCFYYFDDEHSSPLEVQTGTFFMVRRKISIEDTIQDLTTSIFQWEQEQHNHLQPLKDEIHSLEQRATRESQKASTATFFRGSHQHNERKICLEIIDKKKVMNDADKWVQNLQLYHRRIEFYKHLAQRYGQKTVTVLEHDGFNTFRKKSGGLHDPRSGSIFFTLFGSERITKFLFKLASQEVKGDFIQLLWGLCRQTPYIGSPVGEELNYYSSDCQKLKEIGYKDERKYHLFDQVRHFKLYDEIEGKRVSLSHR